MSRIVKSPPHLEDQDGVSEFENALRIDPSALDIEWLEQPQTFFYYTKKLAIAQRELDRLKQRHDVIQAKVDTKVRSYYTDKKPPETAIRGEVVQDREVLESAKELGDQKYEVDLLLGAVKAFEQRKSALENLVRLQAQNYNAAPREPRDLTTEYEKKLKMSSSYTNVAKSTAGKK